MAQTRLTEQKRNRLRRLAREIVACPAEKATVEAAYQRAAPLVHKAVEARFPPKDMKVLAKYEQAHTDDCINLHLTAGPVEQFQFDRGTGPLTTRINCTRNVFATDDDTTDAVTSWRIAVDAHKQALKAKLEDYSALIQGALTYEQVLEVWPEAEAVRAEMNAQAVIVLSQDVVARIRADVALRAA